jgi:predicted peptidase
MKKLTLKIAILLVGAAVPVPFMASAAEPTTGQKPCELDRTIKVQMKYLLALPKDYGQKESWPLLLFLHGAGERGDNLDLDRIYLTGLSMGGYGMWSLAAFSPDRFAALVPTRV